MVNRLPTWLADLWGFRGFTIAEDGRWTIADPPATFSAEDATCTVQSLVLGPSEFLEQLLAAKTRSAD